MKNILLLAAVILLACPTIGAQADPSNAAKYKAKTKKTRRTPPRQQEPPEDNFMPIELNTFTVFEVKVWVIACEEENKQFVSNKIRKSFERANDAFYHAALRFEINGDIRFRCDTAFSPFIKTDAKETALYNKYCSYKGPKYINLFIVDRVASSEELPDGTLGYTYMPYYKRPFCREFIVLSMDGMVMTGTLTHELGHFFGLHHTHGDDKTFEKELASGANCAWAGDSLCDTPADRSFLLKNKVNAIGADCHCIYTGDAVDEQGDRFQPLADNIMSYTPDKCRLKFTAGQLNKITFYARWRRQQFKHRIDKKQSIAWDVELTTGSLVDAKEAYGLSGRRRNVLLFVFQPENTLSQNLYYELSRPDVQELLHKYDYKVMFFNADENRQLVDFLGNDVLFIEAFNNLQRWLRKEIIHFPALFTIRFDWDREARILTSRAFGYMNPRTLRNTIVRNGSLTPGTLSK